MSIVLSPDTGIATPSPVVLEGSSSGTITLAAPAVAGSNTQTLVATTGTLAPIVSGTAVASTSGTSIDFTGIPSWVKRLTVMFNSVSTNGTSNLIVQLGDSGGVETTGYVNVIGNTTGASANAGASYTNGCNVPNFAAASSISGQVIFSNLSNTNWVFSGLVADPTAPRIVYSAGIKSLSAALNRVRVTTTNGTDAFDAGAINILYE